MDLTRKPDPMKTIDADILREGQKILGSEYWNAAGIAHFLRRCPSPALVADPSSTLAEIFATCSYETMCVLSVGRLTSRANHVPDAVMFSDCSVLIEGQTFKNVFDAEFAFNTEFAFAGEIK